MTCIIRDILRYFGMLLKWNSMAWHAISGNLTLKSLLILPWIIAEYKLDFKAPPVWLCTSEPRMTWYILSSSWRTYKKCYWWEQHLYVLGQPCQCLWAHGTRAEGQARKRNSLDAVEKTAPSGSFAISSWNAVAWSSLKVEPPNSQPCWQIHGSQRCETAHQHLPTTITQHCLPQPCPLCNTRHSPSGLQPLDQGSCWFSFSWTCFWIRTLPRDHPHVSPFPPALTQPA